MYILFTYFSFLLYNPVLHYCLNFSDISLLYSIGHLSFCFSNL